VAFDFMYQEPFTMPVGCKAAVHPEAEHIPGPVPSHHTRENCMLGVWTVHHIDIPQGMNIKHCTVRCACQSSLSYQRPY